MRFRLRTILLTATVVAALPVAADEVYVRQLRADSGPSPAAVTQQNGGGSAFVVQVPEGARPRQARTRPRYVAANFVMQAEPMRPENAELAVTPFPADRKPGLPSVGVGANAVLASLSSTRLPNVGRGLVN